MFTVHFDYDFICNPFKSITLYRDISFLFPAPIRNILLYHLFLQKLSKHTFLCSGGAVLPHSQVYIKHF